MPQNLYLRMTVIIVITKMSMLNLFTLYIYILKFFIVAKYFYSSRFLLYHLTQQ